MGFRETRRLQEMADAARDWQEARLADAGFTAEELRAEGMADEARDWWAGLTDAERAEAESEYFANCSDEVNSCWSYLDIFRAKAEGRVFGNRYDPLDEWRNLGKIQRFTSARRVDRRCKLTPQQVQWLREHYDGFMTMRNLAFFCGLSVSTVCKILRGEYWKELEK